MGLLNLKGGNIFTAKRKKETNKVKELENTVNILETKIEDIDTYNKLNQDLQGKKDGNFSFFNEMIPVFDKDGGTSNQIWLVLDSNIRALLSKKFEYTGITDDEWDAISKSLYESGEVYSFVINNTRVFTSNVTVISRDIYNNPEVIKVKNTIIKDFIYVKDNPEAVAYYALLLPDLKRITNLYQELYNILMLNKQKWLIRTTGTELTEETEQYLRDNISKFLKGSDPVMFMNEATMKGMSDMNSIHIKFDDTSEMYINTIKQMLQGIYKLLGIENNPESAKEDRALAGEVNINNLWTERQNEYRERQLNKLNDVGITFTLNKNEKPTERAYSIAGENGQKKQ